MVKISVITPSIRPGGLIVNQKSLQEQTFQDFEWLVEIGIPPAHDLNAAFNRMLRRAQGELVVFYQDFIKARPDYLQKFWDAYQKDKRVFYTAPVGKVNNLDFSGDVRWDWRAYADAKCDWRTWEIDSGSAPLTALKEIGGFDETLDDYWSSDNVNVGCRAELAGYTFKNLTMNPAVAYDHDAHIEHPFRDRFNPDFNTQRMSAFREGLKINYLG